MKEEIKEILELYKNDDIEYYNLVSDLGYDKLLDYITNLQEEINKLTAESTEWESKFYDLQEENKRLKELDENYPIEEQLEEALKYENIYKQRNEKAIEDLEKTKELNDKHILARDNIIIHLDIDHIEYLLNILKGDKDE